MKNTFQPTRVLAGLVAASALVLAGCTAVPGDGGEDVVGAELITADNPYALPEGWTGSLTFELGPFPEGTLFARGPEAFLDTIEELSDGAIEINLSTGQALFAQNETTAAVRDGVTDAAFFQFSSEPSGYDYETAFGTTLSAALDDHRPGIAELAGFSATAQAGFEDEAAIAEYERQGVYPLVPRFAHHDSYNQLCTSEVTTLAQAAGKIIRTPGPAWERETKALGFSPVSIPPLEQFEALQRGVVDCVVGPLRDWALLDLFTAAKYALLDDTSAFTGNIGGFIVNPAWWGSLPAGARNIVFRAAYEYTAAYAQASVQRDFVSAQSAVKAGVTVNTMSSDYRKALEAAQAAEIEEILDNPPAGVSADDLQAGIDALSAAFDEWVAYLEEDPALADFPTAYEDFFEFAQDETGDFTATAWAERLWTETFEPHMPVKPKA